MMRFDDDENKAWDVEYIVQSLPYLETTSEAKNNFKHNKSPEYKLRFFHLTSANHLPLLLMQTKCKVHTKRV